MFTAFTPFGQVPRPADNPLYPKGYGIPNPVPEVFSTGPGTPLQCERAFTLTELIQQIWRTQQRGLYVKGTVSAATGVNFTGGSFEFEHTVTPPLADDPAPMLPRPTGTDPRIGPVTLTTPGGILTVGMGREQIAEGIIGTVDLVTRISDGSTQTDMPVIAAVYARQLLDFYPWYTGAMDGGNYFCNIDMELEVECRLENPEYVGTPDATPSVPGWGMAYADASGYRRSAVGQLWGAGTPGTQSTRPDQNGSEKLAEFSLVERAAPTDPFTAQLSLERVAFIVSANYSLRS